MSTPERDLEPAEALRAEREAELEAELASDLDLARDRVAESAPATLTPELTLAFSPRQVLGGFALLAAILIVLFRRRKSGKG